jgi:hypothetical protein
LVELGVEGGGVPELPPMAVEVVHGGAASVYVPPEAVNKLHFKNSVLVTSKYNNEKIAQYFGCFHHAQHMKAKCISTVGCSSIRQSVEETLFFMFSNIRFT